MSLKEIIPICKEFLNVLPRDDITKRFLSTKCEKYQYILNCIDKKEFDENYTNEAIIQEFVFDDDVTTEKCGLIQTTKFSNIQIGSTHYRDFHDFDLKIISKLAMLEFLARTGMGIHLFRDLKCIETNSEFRKLDYSIILKKDKDFSGCEIKIPFVLALVIDGIRKTALETEDIFRKSIKFTLLMDFFKDLHKLLSSDSNSILEIFNCFQGIEPLLLCSTMKMLLQNFNPIFPTNVLKFLYSLPNTKPPELTILLYQCLMLQIPEPERSILESVLYLLETVVQNQSKNNMCIKSIATLFAPVLLNPDQEAVSSAIDVLIQMIHYRDLIFLIPRNVITRHRNDNADFNLKTGPKRYIKKKSSLTGNDKSVVLCHFKHKKDGDFRLEEQTKKLTEDNEFTFKYKRRIVSYRFSEVSATKDAVNAAVKDISQFQNFRLFDFGGNIHQLCLHPSMQLIKAIEDNCSGQFVVDLVPEYDTVKATMKSLNFYLKRDDII